MDENLNNKMKDKIKFDWMPITISYMEGLGAKNFLEKYESIVDEDYKKNPNLKGLKLNENGRIVDSNLFSTVLTNQILNPQGIRTPTPEDMQTMTQFCLPYGCGDIGLILRGEPYVNTLPGNRLAGLAERKSSLHKNLLKQIINENSELDKKRPLVIPLTELELSNAENYHGLEFNLKHNAKIYNHFPCREIKRNEYTFEDLSVLDERASVCSMVSTYYMCTRLLPELEETRKNEMMLIKDIGIKNDK